MRYVREELRWLHCVIRAGVNAEPLGQVCTYIGNIVRYRKQVQQPKSRIQQGFFNLVPFPFFIVDSGFVLCKPYNCNCLLLFGQPLGFRWIRWRNVEEKDPPDDGKGTKYDEGEFPSWYINADEAYCVAQKTTENVGHAVHREPQGCAKRLLAPDEIGQNGSCTSIV